MKNLVFNIWKIAAISAIVGILLIVIGLSLGANKSMYLDSKGVHVGSNDSQLISELNLEKLTDIDIDIDLSNIEFVKSDKYGFEIKYYENSSAPTWNVENGHLRIDFKHKKTYFNLGFFQSSNEAYIKVFLPQDALLNSIQIKTNVGNVDIGNFSSKNVNINTSIGNIKLSRAKIDDFIVKSNTGEVQLDECTISNCNINNNIGKILGTNLKTSNLNIEADVSNVNIEGEFLKKTKLRTNIGEITLTTSKDKEFYSYDINTEFGKIKIDNKNEDTKLISESNNSENNLEITTNTGDITVNFSN